MLAQFGRPGAGITVLALENIAGLIFDKIPLQIKTFEVKFVAFWGIGLLFSCNNLGGQDYRSPRTGRMPEDWKNNVLVAEVWRNDEEKL